MNHVIVISCDSHAGPPPDVYRQYLDPEFRSEFDREIMQRPPDVQAMKTLGAEDTYGKWDLQSQVGWDATERGKVLDADGVVAEILFSDSFPQCTPPFGAGLAFPQVGVSKEKQWAGARAHNRWIAEFCGEGGGRYFGVANVPLTFDVGMAVSEVRSAADKGLRAVAIPSMVAGAPQYHHRRYDPFWEACQELGVCVCFHAGAVPIKEYYGSRYPEADEAFVGARGIHIAEIMYWAYRPLTFLIWGGVLERYSKLRIAVTEVGSLAELESYLYMIDMPYGSSEGVMKDYRSHLSMSPSAYFRRNVAVSGFGFSLRDARERKLVDARNILWGSDYPHPEGTWPHTRKILLASFAGGGEREVAAALGENAIEWFGLQKYRSYFESRAESIGPDMTEFSTP